MIGGGVAAEEAPGEVDPPELPVVRDHPVGKPWLALAHQGVARRLLDPSCGARAKAEEPGEVGGLIAIDGLELGGHVVTGADDEGHDADALEVSDLVRGLDVCGDVHGGAGRHVGLGTGLVEPTRCDEVAGC